MLYVLGICLLLCSVSCRDDLIEKRMAESDRVNPEDNVELSLDGLLGEEEYETDSLADEMRSFTLVSGSAGERNRPHIQINKGETIVAHLFFAYANKDLRGNPTVIQTPIPITFTAKTARTADARKGSYSGLEALRQTINIPNFAANKDKVWFVMGGVGGTKSNNKLSFDPNNQLMGMDNDLVAAGDTKSGVDIPYTFPWTRINFETIRKTDYNSPRTVDAAQLKGLRFSPRGMFVRFKVLNTNPDNGVFVLKNVSVPVQTDYAPYASLKLTGITLDELTGGKHMGFVAEGFTTPRNYSFKYGLEVVEVLYAYNAATKKPMYKTLVVNKYAHYVGRKQVTTPIKIDPNPSVGYFWMWFADLKPTASKIKMELIGDPLGALASRQSTGDRLTARIPEGKAGYTIARDFNLTKTRQLIPLEFVARGNMARPGTAVGNEGFEVGPKVFTLGYSINNLNYAGGSFGEHEVYNFPDYDHKVEGIDEKADYKHSNRFIPTVDDWRTVVPIFRWGGRLKDEAFLWENRNPAEPNQTYTGYVGEAGYGDVFGMYNEGKNRLFGRDASKPQISFDDEREEVSRFRFRGGGYQNERTKAYYKRADDNMIYGTRWLRHNERSFEERRRYFSAYRMSYNPNTDTKGTLTVEAVYIGTERINKTNEAQDVREWVERAGNPQWWLQKYQEGEVVVRTFPGGGFTNPGLKKEGEMSRYYADNRYYNSENRDLATFEFSKSGHTVHIGSVNVGHNRTANNMLLRYFVTDPYQAYQEWGSRN